MKSAALILALSCAAAALEPTHLELRLAGGQVLLWPLAEAGTLRKSAGVLRIRDTSYALGSIRVLVFRSLATALPPSTSAPARGPLAVLAGDALRFRLPAAGKVKVWLSDVRGRPMRLLWRGHVPAGIFQVSLEDPPAAPAAPGARPPGLVVLERNGVLSAVPAAAEARE